MARKVPSVVAGNSEDSCCPEGLSDGEVQKKRTLMTVNATRKIKGEQKIWMLICFAQKQEHGIE